MALINRWYGILNRMAYQKEMGLEVVKNELGISHQTLIKSIDQLNDLLTDHLHIYQEQGRLVLEVYDYEAFEQILLGRLRQEADFNSGSKRASYLLKRLILSQSPLLIDDLAEELGVSRGTINKDLRQAKQLAQSYQVTILGTPNRGLEISGSELDLRLLYIHQVYNYFDSDDLLADSNRFLQDLVRRYQLPASIGDRLAKVMGISLHRLHHQNMLTESIPYYHNDLLDSDIMGELVYHIETNYQLSLSHYEIDFLSFPLNSQYIEGLAYQKAIDPKLKQVFQNLLVKVGQDFLLTFDRDKLFDDIQTHLKFLVNRLIFRLETRDFFQKEIRLTYPLAFEIAKEVGQYLAREVGREIDEAEISYLAIYFEMALRHSEEHASSRKRIAVVCTTGRGTAAMMMRQLRRVLGQEVTLVQYAEENFKASDVDDYFAIFTTVPLKFEKTKVPVIQMTNLFDDSWLRNEWQKVRLYHQKNLETLDLKFIRLKEEASYPAYLSRMLDDLERQGLVDQGFRQAIFNREEKQSTLFGGGVAFPHTINESSSKSFLMLGVLDVPYQAETDVIDFIFMVGIPSNISIKGEEELLELYDDIFRVVNDQGLKTELKNLQTEDEFIDLTAKRGVF